MGIKKRVARSSSLPLLALRGLVVFPGMLLHFDVGRQKSIQALNASMGADQIIYLVTQRDVAQDDPSVEGLYTVGVVAKVRQVLKLPGDNLRILVEGLYRAGVEEVLQTEPFLMVAVRERLERRIAGSLRAQAVMRECRTYFEEYAQLAPKMAPDVSLGVAAAQDAGYLADYIAANIALPPEEKQDILSTAPVEKRMELLLSLLARECSILELEQDIHERVHEQLDQNQKE